MGTTPTDGASLLQSGVVAAVVAGLVSFVALIVSGRRARIDRQRQLFADAFEAAVAYREFAYIVRRRRDDSQEEHGRISREFSAVQSRLASLGARVQMESPKVGAAYGTFVARTREIAGAQVRAGWTTAPVGTSGTGSIGDVDFSGLRESEEAYLDAARSHLDWWRRG